MGPCGSCWRRGRNQFCGAVRDELLVKGGCRYVEGSVLYFFTVWMLLHIYFHIMIMLPEQVMITVVKILCVVVRSVFV